MMKRLISLLLSITLLFVFVGCEEESVCTNHTFGAWSTTTQATCATDGKQERTCPTCGKKETQNTPKSSQHTFNKWTISTPSTCKTAGVESRSCSVCGLVETQSTPVSTSHSIVSGKCTVCAKITNAYDAFVAYVRQNGDYDDDNYSLLLGVYTSNETIYSRAAYYYPNEGKLSITILYDSDYYLSITINKNSSIYSYGMLADDMYMTGSFYPSTFSKSTNKLSYSYTDIVYASLKASCQELAASLAKLLLAGLNDDIEDSGITAYMLGFLNY